MSFVQFARLGLSPVPVFDYIGEPAERAEHDHIRLLHRCKDIHSDVTLGRVKGDRELIEEARDYLTDTLQWIEEHDGTRDRQ
jgi:hypothetical protein